MSREKIDVMKFKPLYIFWHKPVYEHLYFDVRPPDHMGIDYRLLLGSFGLKLCKLLLFLIELKLCQLACVSWEQNKMK